MRRFSAPVTRLFTSFRLVVLAIRLHHAVGEDDFVETAEVLEEVIELVSERRRWRGKEEDSPGGKH